jgi:hypothetical protein
MANKSEDNIKITHWKKGFTIQFGHVVTFGIPFAS